MLFILAEGPAVYPGMESRTMGVRILYFHVAGRRNCPRHQAPVFVGVNADGHGRCSASLGTSKIGLPGAIRERSKPKPRCC